MATRFEGSFHRQRQRAPIVLLLQQLAYVLGGGFFVSSRAWKSMRNPHIVVMGYVGTKARLLLQRLVYRVQGPQLHFQWSYGAIDKLAVVLSHWLHIYKSLIASLALSLGYS